MSRLLPLALVLALAAGAAAQDRIPSLQPPGNAQSWRWWWEFNRETFARYRAGPGRRSGFDKQRETIRAALVRIGRGGDKANRSRRRFGIVEAGLGDQPRLRAAAIVALGRLGDQRDVPLLLAMLRNIDERQIIKEACALALAVVPPIDDSAIAAELRKRLCFWLEHARWNGVKVQPSIPHALLSVTAGMRARDDFDLLDAFAGALRKPAKSTREYKTSLLIGSGLAASPMLLPEVSQAVSSRIFAGERLNDAWRADATTALARLGPTGAPLLVDALEKKLEQTGVHTRRAAALGLGRLLRGGLDGAVADRAEAALAKALWEKGTPVLGGFAAIALGEARPPRRVRDLIRALEDPPDEARRPYVALALGIAGRFAPIQEAQLIRSALLDALKQADHVELEASLCIAVGLAQANRALVPLLERLDRARMVVVDAAAQGLGLLDRNDPRAMRLLLKALRSRQLDLVEDAALSLVMLGDREMGRRLSGMYAAAHGSQTRRALRVAIAQAAGRLRLHELTSRLLASMETMNEDPRTREAAAVALGFLMSPHERDPFAEMHGDFEFHARSTTTEHVTWLCGNYMTITRPKTNPHDHK